jgi:hypothetical protein
VEAAEKKRRKAEDAASVARAAKDKARTKAARAQVKAAKLEAAEAKRKHEESEEKIADLSLVKSTRDISEKALAIREEPKFDLTGVSTYLKNAHHIELFRSMVMHGAALKYLPFDQQKWLAKKVVELAKERNEELTGSFISRVSLQLVRALVRDIRRDHGEKLENPDKDEDPWWKQHSSKDEQERTAEKIGIAARALDTVSRHMEKNPEIKPLPVLRDTVNGACYEFSEFKSKFLDGEKKPGIIVDPALMKKAKATALAMKQADWTPLKELIDASFSQWLGQWDDEICVASEILRQTLKRALESDPECAAEDVDIEFGYAGYQITFTPPIFPWGKKAPPI